MIGVKKGTLHICSSSYYQCSALPLGALDILSQLIPFVPLLKKLLVLALLVLDLFVEGCQLNKINEEGVR
jgi:hypothetical protein